jgi:hypothetical protein
VDTVKRIHLKTLIVVIGVILASLGFFRLAEKNPQETDPKPATTLQQTGPKVVIFVIDGPRWTETLGDSAHRHIPLMWNRLKPQGTLFTDFRNEGLTLTNPGHCSILTGTWQTVANDGSQRPTMPTLYEYFRKAYQAPQNAAYVVSGKSKLNVCSYSRHPDFGADFGAAVDVGYSWDDEVYERLISVLKTDSPRLALACFPSVDKIGHWGNWDGYLGAMRNVDSLAYACWDYLQSDPYYAGDTYLFITADHGRHSDGAYGFQNHGCACEGCERLFLLALGPDIKVNHTVHSTYTQRDLCPTVAQIFGFPAPYAEGDVIAEMFGSIPAEHGERAR